MLGKAASGRLCTYAFDPTWTAGPARGPTGRSNAAGPIIPERLVRGTTLLDAGLRHAVPDALPLGRLPAGDAGPTAAAGLRDAYALASSQ